MSISNYRKLVQWGVDPIDFNSQRRKTINQQKRDMIAMACSGPNMRHRQALWGLFLLLGLIWTPTQAQPTPVSLEVRSDFYHPLGPDLDYFLDPSATLTIDDIWQSENQFSELATKYVDFGIIDSRVWLRFSVANDTAQSGIWRLDLARQYIQEMDIYLIREGRPPKRILRHTQEDLFSERKIASRFLAVDIALAPLEQVEIYTAYRSTSTTFLPLAIGTVGAVANTRVTENTVNWLINGALMAMIGLAVLMIPLIGWRLSAAFCLYIIGGGIYVFHADSYTFQYIFPGRPALNDPLNLALGLMMPIFGLTFALTLFDLKTVMPIFQKIVVGIIVLASSVAVLAIALIDVGWFVIMGYLLIPVGAIAQMVIAVRVFRKKIVGATPYLIGACFVLASLLYATTAHLVPGHFNLDRTLDFGHLVLLIEALAFASAIVLRLLAVRQERDQALRSQLHVTQEKLSLAKAIRKSQKNYNEALRVASRQRAQLSSVSHDLQQPLASLRHALDRLEDGGDQFKEQMYAAFTYLEKLAGAQLQKDDAGKGEHDAHALEVFPISVVLDNVCEMFKDEAMAKGLSFRYRPHEALVRTDAIVLMRAVNNLVSNAVKYTQKGSVLLACRRIGDGLRIEVWDTGDGMDAAQLQAAMTRHERGAQSKGAGLGLAIVEEISQKLGLSFKMHSRPGKGSVAFLSLPVSPAP